MGRKTKKALAAADEASGELTIPSFMLWLRVRRQISQAELAELLDTTRGVINNMEKSRTVFPYQKLRELYQDVLTKPERQYFLTCIRGHVELLMESHDDVEFKEKVTTPPLRED